MTIIRRFTYSSTEITNIAVDETNGYVWLGFSQDEDGVCHLKMVSANSLDQVYYDIEIEASQIIDIKILGDYLYVLYNGEENFLTSYYLPNPLTSQVNFARQDTDEDPIGLTVLGSYVYLLLPGELSGTNAKILKYSLSGNYSETIDLFQSGEMVTEARSITNDGIDIWVITHKDISELVRVFHDSVWNIVITELSE